MNAEIMSLASNCGVLHIGEPDCIESFYRQAFNAGIAAAAKACGDELPWGNMADDWAAKCVLNAVNRIKELEMK